MTDRDQIDAFSDDVDRLVDRYRAEFDLTYAAVIGVLQMKLFLLRREAAEEGGDDEDSGD